MTTAKVAPVTAVLSTYNRNRVLIDTLQALLELPVRAAEIIVVDQSKSHDEVTQSRLADWHEDGSVQWLRLPAPSIPRAMNEGLLAATHGIALFLDDDIIPDAGLVEAHARSHGGAAAGIVAGRVLQPWHAGRADFPGQEPFRFNSLEPRNVSEFMGGNFSVPREDALAIGGFDENFVRVAYRFEAEFADRWRRSGREIRYQPEALVHHLKAGSGGTREFGDHLSIARPDHSVGAYYFLFKSRKSSALLPVLQRIGRSVITRHHLSRPWWIPVTLFAEVVGLLWSLWLVMQRPRYVDRASGRAGFHAARSGSELDPQ